LGKICHIIPASQGQHENPHEFERYTM